ncbi:MAG: hypothetical protein M0010_06575 [Actinomycetota bacterium]|nr:hypothetical protein [Actinomycetota bacterium]
MADRTRLPLGCEEGRRGTAGERGPGIAGEDGRASMGLHEAATRYGAYRWVERRLFEVTGAWAAAPSLSDEAQVFCFEVSTEHAWHAELWEARLPVLAGVDRERLTRPLGPTVEPLLARLAPETPGGTDEAAGRRFLVGLARVVLPLLLVSYRGLGRRLVPVADAPAIRALTLVQRDEEEELAAAQAIVDAFLGTPEAAQEAAEWTRELGDPALQLALQSEESDGLLPWSEGPSAW